jgi:hypothetical protein
VPKIGMRLIGNEMEPHVDAAQDLVFEKRNLEGI